MIFLPDGVCLCYEETKGGLKLHLQPDVLGMSECLELMKTQGRPDMRSGERGVKAFFMAILEGENVRVFTDHLMPMQTW